MLPSAYTLFLSPILKGDKFIVKGDNSKNKLSILTHLHEVFSLKSHKQDLNLIFSHDHFHLIIYLQAEIRKDSTWLSTQTSFYW